MKGLADGRARGTGASPAARRSAWLYRIATKVCLRAAERQGRRPLRARAHARPGIDDVLEPTEPAVRARVDRYVTAFENADLDTLMRQDVVWEMPPLPGWYAGRDAVRRFVGGTVLSGPGGWRATRTATNGQPALALYRREHDGSLAPHGIQVLTTTPDGFASVVTFLGPTHVEAFGLV